MVKCVYNRLKFCLTLAALAASQLVVLNRFAAFLAQALRALSDARSQKKAAVCDLVVYSVLILLDLERLLLCR